MGATNQTANIGLPQFIDSDKPTWRGDINGAFLDLDSYAGSTTGDLGNRYTKTETDTLLDTKTTPADVATLIAAQHFPVNVRAYGAVGDGTANDTTAIADALTAASAARVASGLKSVAVYFPAGIYKTTRFAVPGGVCLFGDGQASTRIVNMSTDGLVFVLFRGSNSYTWNLDYDGKRASQATLGLATVQFSKPNQATGGGTNISGGVLLTSNVAATATALPLSTASTGAESIMPGDNITLVEGALYELAVVAETYAGGLSIPLKNPLAQAFTVAAKVSVAITNVGIHDCTVRGNGRDGVAFWHTIYGYADRNTVVDYEDTGIDLPSAGSRFVRVRGNVMETQGRWGISFDNAETEFGVLSDCSSEGNTIRFLSGGSFFEGNTIDGIYMGNVKRCYSVNDIFDLRLAGISGVSYYGGDGTLNEHCHVVNPTVIGPATNRVNTQGVANKATAGNAKITVSGGRISNMETGIELGSVLTAVVTGTQIKNTTHAVSTTGDVAHAQKVSVIGVQTETGVTGVRFGGTPHASNSVSVTGCINLDASYSDVFMDAGWNLVQTGNIS